MKREIRLNVLRNWRFVLEWATFVSIICMIVTFALTASVLPMPAPPADADGRHMRVVVLIIPLSTPVQISGEDQR